MSEVAIQQKQSLKENPSAVEAAEFLLSITSIKDPKQGYAADLKNDFLRALQVVIEEPTCLVCRIQSGTFYSNGTDHPDYKYVSIAHNLSTILDKLELSDTELAQIRDQSLIGAAHTSFAKLIDSQGFLGGSEAAKVPRDLALLAVKATRQLRARSYTSEDLGCFGKN